MIRWIVAVYLRLSRDDKDKLESYSIVNQRELIERFLSEKKDMVIFKFYIDDGYTGTDFNRPGYIDMMQDIINKKVNTIIVKDLSRIGRNYIEVGNFIDEIIPLYNLRFISVNDNVDSFENPNSLTTLEIPFKNLMNENYAKDISLKVKSTLKIKKQNGEFVGAYAPFGYIKDPKNKNKLLIDEEAAKIVKRIFEYALKGLSRREIADELNSLHIICPSEYMYNLYGVKTGAIAKKWNLDMVDRILKNETYLGNLVQNKFGRVSHKNHTKVLKSSDEWIKIENTHEPIIDKKTFTTVNSIIYDRGVYTNKSGKYNLYSGYLKCPDCGASLVRTGNKKGNSYSYYYCSTYRKTKCCSKHRVSDLTLNKVVKEVINKYILNLCDIDKKIDEVLFNSKLQYDKEISKIREIELKKEIAKYQTLVDSLLSDYENDIITREELEKYNINYLTKLNDLRIEQEELVKSKDINNDWINQFRELGEIENLTRKIITKFIENIYVYETGVIKIEFKFKDEYQDLIMFLKKHNCVI